MDHRDGFFPGLVYPAAPGYRLWVVPPTELGHTESVMFYAHEDGTIYGWRIQNGGLEAYSNLEVFRMTR